jgi:hypothetical protein
MAVLEIDWLLSLIPIARHVYAGRVRGKIKPNCDGKENRNDPNADLPSHPLPWT